MSSVTGISAAPQCDTSVQSDWLSAGMNRDALFAQILRVRSSGRGSPLRGALELEVAALRCMMTGMKFPVSSRSVVLLNLK